MPYTVGMVRRLDVDALSVVRGLNAIWTGIRPLSLAVLFHGRGDPRTRAGWLAIYRCRGSLSDLDDAAAKM